MLELGRLFKRRVCWIYKCPHFPEAEKVSSMFVVCGYIYIYMQVSIIIHMCTLKPSVAVNT